MSTVGIALVLLGIAASISNVLATLATAAARRVTGGTNANGDTTVPFAVDVIGVALVLGGLAVCGATSPA